MVVVFPEKPMWPPRGSSPLQSCWCCVTIRVTLIDGAGPTTLAQDQTSAQEPGVNGKDGARQMVQENARPDTPKPVETEKEQVQTNTSPKCTFSRTVVAVDLKRFTES